MSRKNSPVRHQRLGRSTYNRTGKLSSLSGPVYRTDSGGSQEVSGPGEKTDPRLDETFVTQPGPVRPSLRRILHTYVLTYTLIHIHSHTDTHTHTPTHILTDTNSHTHTHTGSHT